jgi:hypothetical protein
LSSFQAAIIGSTRQSWRIFASMAGRARVLTRKTVGAPSLRDKIQRKEIGRENLQGVGHDRGLQANAIGVLFGMK